MNKLFLLISTILLVTLSACNGGGSNDSSSSDDITPPTSANGKKYKLTMISGKGIFASTGSGDISFTADTYTIDNVTGDVLGQNGTYTYSVSGTNGVMELDNSWRAIFTFTTNTSGTFYNTVIDTPDANNQSGTFEEQ